ncbi:right-handed parallel beta-helix repeat-containing protein [Klebsiella grimontii]|uniref:right-handed parallel beta-helix repeat-containing protein n=1 Tax=Klebsiella grimontii TaxID=2058152 RepID=UPI00292DBD58|nr:right-handed parallel beta-helix repeat-containing protein [Klebsiella grimontii]
MTRYNTGYPVPSPAMPDVWDNNETIDSFVNSPENSVTTRTGIVRDTMFGMQKKADEQRIAASVALAEQMDSQESAFNAAQTDKEDRFQGFLNSSGYVFLGNYENGPFQFSARNQYIRYNNQYYRLNAATDIGFTTTGTDANSFANDVTHFVLMDGDTLRQNLSSSDGASLIGGLGFLTPEMFGAKRDGVSYDSEAVLLAIERASIGPTKIIWVGGGKYLCDTVNFNIPSGVSIIGGGEGSGFIFPTPPSSAMHEFFTLAGNGSLLKDFSIQFNTGGLGSIGAPQAYGVWFKDTSTNCRAEGLTIDGKYSDTIMGFSNGVRCVGTGNTVDKCNIQYCSMGITARGDKHQITRNYCNNHFVDENLSAWTSASPYWDGITAEGLSNSLIADNICEYNGQSGIYIGGNNSLSYDNIISRNTIRYNFNRGIDNGVSGTVSTTNSVLRNIITSNVIYDNREPQLWLFNANDFVVDGNSVRITSNYASIFGSYVSSSTSGIATGGTSISGVIISNNRVIVDYASALYRVVLNGTNMKYVHNTVTGTPPDYMWSIDANRLYNNTISRFQGTFKPTLLSGTGVTVTAATGYYSINDKVLRFSMQLTLSGSTPSGNLVFGYLPGMSSATIRISLVSANNATGWNTMTGSLKAYQDGTNKDQIIVYRDTGGVGNLDAAAYVGAASTILITGEIEVASTY